MMPPIPNINSSSSAAVNSTAQGPTFGNMKAVASGAAAGNTGTLLMLAAIVAAVGGTYFLLRKKKA